MDLFCPHCTRRVSVPDDKAGQVLSCPLCTKQFMAPTLTPPAAPRPPAPPPLTSAPAETFGIGPAPAPPPPLTSAAPMTLPTPAAPPEPPPPPPPPGEYTRSCVFPIRAEWLAFVPTLCLILIFVLSFFNWHLPVPPVEPASKNVPALSMWSLAFTEHGQAQFLAYAILMLLAIPVTILVLVVDTGVIQPLTQIKPLMIFKNLLIGLFLGIPFLLLCYDYADAHFLSTRGNPLAVAEKVVFRLHFLAVLVCFVMTWLNWRRTANLPPPRLEAHW